MLNYGAAGVHPGTAQIYASLKKEFVMIVILKQNAPADKVAAFCRELETMGVTNNDSVGQNTHILGPVG